MEYVNLGNAGVKVSRIALGLGMRELASADDAQRHIEHALDSDVNFIDCANTYGPGEWHPSIEEKVTAEEILGRVLRTRRDEVVLLTKVVGELGPGPNDRGSSRLHIMREVDRSLSRLGTDRIDVYMLHGYVEDTPLEETIRVLDDLVTMGKVGYVGCSNFTAWQVCRALWIADRVNADPFVCVQNCYSLLDRELEVDMFGLVRDQGLGVMVYAPLAIGLLSGEYTAGEPPPPGSHWTLTGPGVTSHQPPPGELRCECGCRGGGARFDSALPLEAAPVLDAVRDIARERGKTMPQVALNWVLSHPEATVAISGGDRIEQLDENIGAVGWRLSDEEMLKLNKVSAAAAPYTIIPRGVRDWKS